jgi:hypothetical protein
MKPAQTTHSANWFSIPVFSGELLARRINMKTEYNRYYREPDVARLNL